LEIAVELFRQRGFEETTMREIASACGIALGDLLQSTYKWLVSIAMLKNKDQSSIRPVH